MKKSLIWLIWFASYWLVNFEVCQSKPEPGKCHFVSVHGEVTSPSVPARPLPNRRAGHWVWCYIPGRLQEAGWWGGGGSPKLPASRPGPGPGPASPQIQHHPTHRQTWSRSTTSSLRQLALATQQALQKSFFHFFLNFILIILSLKNLFVNQNSQRKEILFWKTSSSNI